MPFRRMPPSLMKNGRLSWLSKISWSVCPSMARPISMMRTARTVVDVALMTWLRADTVFCREREF
ncbi:MAG: hypothetical protein Q613_PSC00287G0002 [Propionibacterium sp. DORA_15]|nr:MAG: hypothetical protein Q613_PSC00287G0002 [Propionibacterium sp. DORA_15]